MLIAAENYEGSDASADQLTQLFMHSSDIGGARPKARIRILDKEWIAKLPRETTGSTILGLKRFASNLLRLQAFKSRNGSFVS